MDDGAEALGLSSRGRVEHEGYALVRSSLEELPVMLGAKYIEEHGLVGGDPVLGGQAASDRRGRLAWGGVVFDEDDEASEQTLEEMQNVCEGANRVAHGGEQG